MTEDNHKDNFFTLFAIVKDHGLITSADFVASFAPLLELAIEYHQQKLIMNITSADEIQYEQGKLHYPKRPSEMQQAHKTLFVKPLEHEALEFTASIRTETDIDTSITAVENTLIHDTEESLQKPAYLLHYQSWEKEQGHVDPLTDIFILGQYMASLAYGLNFNIKDDLLKFVNNRKSLYFLNKELHPSIHHVIYEMTEIYREDRTRNLEEAYIKLINYREFNPEHYVDLTQTPGFRNQDISNRSTWILSRLKSRLFDISRRNKLLYFSDKKSFLNLSVGSVPLLLDHNNIREDDIIFWNKKIRDKVISKKKLALNTYLDFKNNRFIAPTLNAIRLTSRKNRNEYGFNTMRLIVAYLHWYNFKDNADEMITSPLLMLPAEVVKKKGVQDRYELIIEDSEAIINPVLSFYLKDLYNISLPDYVDLSNTSVEELIESIQTQIAEGGTGITLEWRQKPRLQLIHSIAKKNLNLRNKALRNKTRGLNLKSFNYSYDSNNFEPLGLQLFESRIKPKHSALEYVINEDLMPDESNAVSEKLRTFYTTREEGDINPTVWQVDTCNMTIGNFNYRKMSLVRDYNDIISDSIKDDVFEQLFSEAPKKTDQADDKNQEPNLKNNYPIISSDPTQNSAVEKARTEESYIIQGPPGTGKSQTITNLIADFVARDKKVLFVCEKRAALDVVYHRLKGQSLQELCCLVHDSQTDKKSFIQDLKVTYEEFLKKDFDQIEIKQHRNDVIDAIQKELDELNYFHEKMGNGDPSPIELFQILNANKVNKTVLSDDELLNFPNYKVWIENADWIEEWLSNVQQNGLGNYISEYPLIATDQELLAENNAKKQIKDIINSTLNVFDAFSEQLDDIDEDINQCSLKDWNEQFQLALRIETIFQKGKLDVFKADSSSAKQLDVLKEEIEGAELSLARKKEKNIHWAHKLTEADLEAALNKWKSYQSNPFRFILPSYYKLKKTLHHSYDFNAHTVSPTVEIVLNNLAEEYSTKREIETKKENAKTQFGLASYQKDIRWIYQMRKEKIRYLEDWLEENKSSLLNTFFAMKEDLAKAFDGLNKLFGQSKELSFQQAENKLQQAENALNSFSAFIPYLKAMHNGPKELKNCLMTRQFDLSSFRYYFTFKSIRDLYEADPRFAEYDEDRIKLSVNRINSLLHQYYDANVQQIRSKARGKFLDMIRVTEASTSQLTDAGKKLKKTYVSSRRILENEFGKSMRYKSIRDLGSSEAREIMMALKPVWLMSPLSVSDTMPLDPNLFDVVIYDEASQITVEEGVPALFRTKQTIIVGDEMQMPPTNFFNSINLQEDEDEELEQNIGINLDADSILNQGNRKLSSLMLGWHYRSKHESLISFSNAAFYQRSLLTIPDNALHNKSLEPIDPILDPSAPVSIEKVLNRSISYHLIENGVYESRRNKDESAYIANIIIALLKSGSKKSVGIVAFSQEQQTEIEETLERQASYDPDFEALLEKAYQRTDEDQYNGLFVKNLENVQGDERDIIIMSVCYGYNKTGRMLMNFGPINRRGGEKRLNVIFSRAKQHMVVVSSIGPQEIKNDYNEGANYFKKFLSYAQHISNGRMNEANGLLDGFNLFKDEKPPLIRNLIAKQIKENLVAKGYTVDVGIGQSHFKCDLGIQSKKSRHYEVGILIDHVEYYNHSNVLEQYCQRPQLLTIFGWKVLNVYAKDWLEKPERVIEKIERLYNDQLEEQATKVEELVRQQVEQDRSANYYKDKPETKEKPISDSSSQETEADKSDSLLKEDLKFERLEFTQGNSDKYWQIAQQESRLIVQYGRIGNNPQENVKAFTTQEKATEEKEKMIAKKITKGYQRK